MNCSHIFKKFPFISQFPFFHICFAGEIGGYMGLLLGCSVLTLCEFLDLIIHNLAMKIQDQHHRLRCTTPKNDDDRRKITPVRD